MNPTAPTTSSSNRVIMIVEDNEQTNTAMKTLLELENYQVAAVGDGDSALRVLRGGLRPGLILLDLRLPGKDAFQFRVEQLQDPELSLIPVVVYSGSPDIAEKAKVLGAVASFHKPIEIDTLLEVVARYCA
jgi:CheY-like chemotaxis protein